jgi:hypothetical protein
MLIPIASAGGVGSSGRALERTVGALPREVQRSCRLSESVKRGKPWLYFSERLHRVQVNAAAFPAVVSAPQIFDAYQFVS